MNLKTVLIVVTLLGAQALGQGGSTKGSAPTTAPAGDKPVVTDAQRLALYSAQEKVTATLGKVQVLPLWKESQEKAVAADAAKKAFDDSFAKLAATQEYKDALAAQTEFKKAQDSALGDTKKWRFGPGWVVEAVTAPEVKK